MRAGKPQILSQEIGQVQANVDNAFDQPAIDRHFYPDILTHGGDRPHAQRLS
jgi:hypothetical protein